MAARVVVFLLAVWAWNGQAATSPAPAVLQADDLLSNVGDGGVGVEALGGLERNQNLAHR